jgi:Polyketide cyclase / dehydrase and lipid transport
MEINPASAASTSREKFIEAPPAAVFSVISDLAEWPAWSSDVKSVIVDGPIEPGTVFRWKAGPSSLTSTLQVVDAPREIGWTGKTMGIRAVHVFRLEPQDGGTLARSEESWDGLVATLLMGYGQRTLDKTVETVLSDLKVESERRIAAGTVYS